MRGILKLMELDICMLEQSCLDYYLLPPSPSQGFQRTSRTRANKLLCIFEQSELCGLFVKFCDLFVLEQKFADNRKVANF